MISKPKHIKHLTLMTRAEEPGHITRYIARCGASGTAARDYSADVTRNGKQVVTCIRCLSLFKPKVAERKTK